MWFIIYNYHILLLFTIIQYNIFNIEIGKSKWAKTILINIILILYSI